MKTYTKFATALLLTGVALSASAAEFCRPLIGAVHLEPDADCKVAEAYPGNAYLKQPNTCFKTTVTGLGRGYSGLTMESVMGVDQGRTVTPNVANEKEAPPMTGALPIPQTRQFFTGRTVLKTFWGDIYAAEAGVQSAKGMTEQAIIVGGTGHYKNARGYMTIFGNYVGGWGTHVGEICTSR
ncbi:hypothetical protein [Chitinivorax sp. B]|uniref:hypothetical protein n=1 Tax=Chitinivorax sp. B TaxID=2502235 RepID=UPI0010F8BB9E|nr:hypothetical protein [Chitinivorax sp. B]